MHDPKRALADKLTSQDGENSYHKNADAHARTQGIAGVNDSSENKFATADYVMRTYRHISVHNASGIVQQRAAHDFDRELNVVSDRRKRKHQPEEAPPSAGFFWRLTPALRRALIAMVRRELPLALKQGRQDKEAHDCEKLKRREEAVQRQLDRVVDKYAEALELYDQWCSQGVKSAAALEKRLEGMSIPQQLAEPPLSVRAALA